MAGVNHNCWSTEHTYDGEDLLPLLEQAWAERQDDPTLAPNARRALHLAVTMGSVPSDYFNYYYFREEVLREQRGAAKTRSEVIMDACPATGSTIGSRPRRPRRSWTRPVPAAASTSWSWRST